MSPLFSRRTNTKKEGERTALILDLENGSAGTALVRLSKGEQPKLFGEMRAYTPLPMTRSGATLQAEIERAAQKALRNAAEVAARVRQHAAASPLGEIDMVAVFMAPPWGSPNLEDGRPSFLESMASFVRKAIGSSFGNVPVGFYTSAGSAAFGTRALMTNEPCLVCAVTGEVSELMRLDEQGVAGHATFPTGTHSYLRTLRTHGNISEEEARSAMKLPSGAGHLKEASAYAAREFAAHFKDAAYSLMRPGELTRVVIVAPEHSVERFARALSDDQGLHELFPEAGEIRALRASYATPHVAAHAETPDLHLLLSALFVDSHLNN